MFLGLIIQAIVLTNAKHANLFSLVETEFVITLLDNILTWYHLQKISKNC